MTTHGDDASAVNRAIGARVAWFMRYGGDQRRTQAELAQLLGIEQSAISKKLTGRRPFYPHELYAIAAWLDRSLGDFLPISAELNSPPFGGVANDVRANSPETGRDTRRLLPELAVA